MIFLLKWQGELDLLGVSVEAVKVVGKSKASAPNTLVTYFQDFFFDLSNALDTSKNVKVSLTVKCTSNIE